jgi:hypothetical protein
MEIDMTATDSNGTTGTISITVLPQANGQYLCRTSTDLSDRPSDIRCYGQTQEHAIAIALEQSADHYRQLAEERQNLDWDAVRTEVGETIPQHYHVIVHYERLAEAESKFEAMQDAMMGNTVVENAKITVIEVAANLPVEPLTRPWF